MFNYFTYEKQTQEREKLEEQIEKKQNITLNSKSKTIQVIISHSILIINQKKVGKWLIIIKNVLKILFFKYNI